MEDFEKWLIDGLEIQTLTDELKDTILERVRELYEDAYTEGYCEAKDNILDYLEDM